MNLAGAPLLEIERPDPSDHDWFLARLHAFDHWPVKSGNLGFFRRLRLRIASPEKAPKIVDVYLAFCHDCRTYYFDYRHDYPHGGSRLTCQNGHVQPLHALSTPSQR